MKKIIKLFENGNVCVTGLRGTGKDMLFANVVLRRNKAYVSNTCYDSVNFIPYHTSDIDCGGNNYKNFINGDVKKYQYPFADGTDVYIADCGIYFPSQYCNELNRDYKNIPTFMALSRHLGLCNVHINVQNLNRCWDKIREQSDQYIRCRWCKVLFGNLVIQLVTIYDKYQSCIDRVPVYSIPRPLLSPERDLQWKLDKQRYDCNYGRIKNRLLVYVNKSNYNTRIFKEVLENGKE